MRSSNNARWFPLTLFFLSALVATAMLERILGDWTIALTDGIVSGALLTAAVWTGMVSLGSYPTRVGMLVYSILIGVAAGISAWYFDKILLRWWFEEDLVYQQFFSNSQPARLVIALLTSCWIISLNALQKQTNALEDEFKNISDAATLHREAELFKLRQQLQPHFLYNSLNSISALILIMPEKAQEMIGRLSDFLRNSVKREAREQIPINEELEYIEAYLSIEAVRFGDRLNVIYHKTDTDGATIPPFLLQPILENAIKFGLYGNTGSVSIYMNIRLQDGQLIITIDNPFDSEQRPPSGTGFGLEGIRRRMYLLYARTDLLETRQEGNTFTTTLKIPQIHV